MLETITTFYNYNAWAAKKLFDVLAPLTEELYNAPGAGGHTSIRDSLAHALNVQRNYFSWFDGSMTIEESIGTQIPRGKFATVAAAKEEWLLIEEKTWRFINSLTDESLVAQRPFTLPNGFSASLPLWKMLLHVANHGTHHRAQIVAALRNLGVEPGNHDMINYFLTQPIG